MSDPKPINPAEAEAPDEEKVSWFLENGLFVDWAIEKIGASEDLLKVIKGSNLSGDPALPIEKRIVNFLTKNSRFAGTLLEAYLKTDEAIDDIDSWNSEYLQKPIPLPTEAQKAREAKKAPKAEEAGAVLPPKVEEAIVSPDLPEEQQRAELLKYFSAKEDAIDFLTTLLHREDKKTIDDIDSIGTDKLKNWAEAFRKFEKFLPILNGVYLRQASEMFEIIEDNTLAQSVDKLVKEHFIRLAAESPDEFDKFNGFIEQSLNQIVSIEQNVSSAQVGLVEKIQQLDKELRQVEANIDDKLKAFDQKIKQNEERIAQLKERSKPFEESINKVRGIKNPKIRDMALKIVMGYKWFSDANDYDRYREMPAEIKKIEEEISRLRGLRREYDRAGQTVEEKVAEAETSLHQIEDRIFTEIGFSRSVLDSLAGAQIIEIVKDRSHLLEEIPGLIKSTDSILAVGSRKIADFLDSLEMDPDEIKETNRKLRRVPEALFQEFADKTQEIIDEGRFKSILENLKQLLAEDKHKEKVTRVMKETYGRLPSDSPQEKQKKLLFNRLMIEAGIWK